MAEARQTEMPSDNVRPRESVVFLGGGRITSAMIAGLRLSGYRRPIVVHDRNPAKLKALKKQHGIVIEPDLARAIEYANLLIIAVRPDSVRDLLLNIRKLLADSAKSTSPTKVTSRTSTHNPPLLAISLAAGVPLAQLTAQVPARVRWTRAMPSPASRTGKGLTAIAFSPKITRIERTKIRRFFSILGPTLEVPEARFDAFTVTYSSSHGYHALAALTDAAVAIGLDRKTALVAAAHALADGILGWREGKIPLEDLLHEAATPGGIAAAVMTGMDSAGYRSAIEKGLRAGLARARSNARA